MPSRVSFKTIPIESSSSLILSAFSKSLFFLASLRSFIFSKINASLSILFTSFFSKSKLNTWSKSLTNLYFVPSSTSLFNKSCKTVTAFAVFKSSSRQLTNLFFHSLNTSSLTLSSYFKLDVLLRNFL